MIEPALFTGLIVSTPSRNGRRLRWIQATAWAIALHGAAVALFLIGPLLVVEPVQPQASVTLIVQPPRPPRNPGDGLPPASIRQGSGDNRRSTEAEPDPQPSIPRHDLQPDRVPIAPPAPAPEGAASLPGDGQGAGSAGGPGHPEGTGDSDTGVLGGCRDCDGTGMGAGDDDPQGPWPDMDDPRVTKPVLIESTRALPRYPDLARKAKIVGEVVLLIVIQADGTVGEIEVLRATDPRLGFDLAAIEAVKHWRYRPALMMGRPVAIQAIVQVEFMLAR